MKIRVLVAEGSERATEIAEISLSPGRGLRFGLELMKFLASWDDTVDQPIVDQPADGGKE